MKADNVEAKGVLPDRVGNEGHGSSTRILVINGEQRESAAPDLAVLLEELRIDASTVVAEHNGRIVEQAHFAASSLSDGDVIELVRFVGGG